MTKPRDWRRERRRQQVIRLASSGVKARPTKSKPARALNPEEVRRRLLSRKPPDNNEKQG